MSLRTYLEQGSSLRTQGLVAAWLLLLLSAFIFGANPTANRILMAAVLAAVSTDLVSRLTEHRNVKWALGVLAVSSAVLLWFGPSPASQAGGGLQAVGLICVVGVCVRDLARDKSGNGYASLVIVGFVAGVMIWRQATPLRSWNDPPENAASAAAPDVPVPTAPISLAGAALRGNSTARVVLIEYTDFECPYCGKFARSIVPTLEKDYVSTGKLLLAVRLHPLESIHKSALRAAEGSVCAGRQGKFWEYHNQLFAHQAEISEDNVALQAAAVGVNMPAFSACMREDLAAGIRAEAKQAIALGLDATPAFLIGTMQPDGTVRAVKALTGTQSLGYFTALIDSLLSEQRPSSGK